MQIPHCSWLSKNVISKELNQQIEKTNCNLFILKISYVICKLNKQVKSNTFITTFIHIMQIRSLNCSSINISLINESKLPKN